MGQCCDCRWTRIWWVRPVFRVASTKVRCERPAWCRRPSEKRFNTRKTVCAADLFDDAEAHAAAAVDGGAGGFVNHQQRVVFVNDVELARGGGLNTVFRRPLFFGGTHGRDAEQVAHLNAAVGLAALFVQAHFSGADNAVDMALGNAFENFYQIVIKALPRLMFGHANQADRIFAYCVRFHL